MIKTYPMARPAASLAVLLARELVGIETPAAVESILLPDKRTRAVAGAIRREFLTDGETNGSAHETLLGLEHRALVRAKYMVVEGIQFPVRAALFTITDKDLAFVPLPKKLRPLYYIIRPLRLMVQRGRGTARRILSMGR